jgi:phage regulator Rha-like protein
MNDKNIIPSEVIEKRIFIIRGQKVMLDFQLAQLYNVQTKRLKEQVRRHLSRFPEDFMFELTEDEFTALRTQFATSNKRGGMRYRPFVFTEQGVAMLATVLNSSRAIHMNIAIMRAFVRLREILSSHSELAAKLKELEDRVEKHDEHIHTLFSAIRQLMEEPEKPKRDIGFRVKEPAAKYGVKRQK